MAFGLAAALLAVVLIAGAHGLRAYFHGLPPRLFAGILGAAALASAAIGSHFVRSAGTEVVDTTCEVVEREVRQPEEGGPVEVLGRVRWRADGRRFTLHEPTVLSRGDATARPVGSTMRCRHLVDEPSIIRLKPVAEWRENRAWLGWSMVAVAIPMLFFAVRMWRRPGRRAWTRGTRGWMGAVLILAVAAGMFAAKHGVPLAGLVGWGAGAALLGLMVFEVIASDRAFDRVRKRMGDAEHWPKPPVEGGGDGIDLYADDRVTGVWKGCRVWVAMTAAGAEVEGQLEGWPAELGVVPAAGAADGRARTGDDVFDDAVAMTASDLAWRPLLDAATRGALVELVGRRGGALEGGRLRCLIGDSEAADLPGVLDRIAALAAARRAIADPIDAVLVAARAEPLVAVRRGHYEWLLARGRDAPLVLRAAADDADPDLAAWARAQLPPDGGAYR